MAREFWIDREQDIDINDDENFYGYALLTHPRQGNPLWQAQLIHVIEYSAFEALKAENARLQNRIEKLREALKEECMCPFENEYSDEKHLCAACDAIKADDTLAEGDK